MNLTSKHTKDKAVLNGFNPITNPMPQGGYSRFELKDKGLRAINPNRRSF